jgi:hypothetical protein
MGKKEQARDAEHEGFFFLLLLEQSRRTMLLSVCKNISIHCTAMIQEHENPLY